MYHKGNNLSSRIITCAYEVYNELGYGFTEKVYQKALRIELERAGMDVAEERQVDIYYKGEYLCRNYIDLLVDEVFILELKTCQLLIRNHFKQVKQYIKATKFNDALLFNFSPEKLEFNRIYQ